MGDTTMKTVGTKRAFCPDCKGKGWEIRTRTFAGIFPDLTGKKVIQRCERCCVYKCDEDAAVVAKKAGVNCKVLFPCVVEPAYPEPEEPLS